ncbi:MAG TPA: hypothetical protein VK179_09750 [Bacteroidales bacterium]|nr:hypothetical protein [Bacteroidales bacterium]
MNKLTSIVKEIESQYFHLKPVKDFPILTGISRKRWGLLIRGEKEPTLKEAHIISKMLKVDLSDLLD